MIKIKTKKFFQVQKDKFLTLYYSIADTRRELQNVLKNSKHSVNESLDSDTLEVIKAAPRKRKRKEKVVVRNNKRARKKNLIYSDLS